MNRFSRLFLNFKAFYVSTSDTSPMSYSIILHAGAADSWAGDTEVQEKTEAFLHLLIDSAKEKLRNGESALKVVTEVVSALEDYPQFNAGKGSALNIDGFHEVNTHY